MYIQSALVASLTVGAFSWPTVEALLSSSTASPLHDQDLAFRTPRNLVPLLWCASLLFALTSIGSAANQTIIIHRLSVYPDGLARIQKLLGNGTASHNSQIGVGALQMWIWQTPAALLNGSLYLFIAGLLGLIWDISNIGRSDTSASGNKVSSKSEFLLGLSTFSDHYH